MRGGRVGVHAGMSATVRDGVPSLDEGISCALSAWHGHAARVYDIEPVARVPGFAGNTKLMYRIPKTNTVIGGVYGIISVHDTPHAAVALANYT